MFAQLAALSDQRSELAQKLIATQESTLRHISRELHDEFGQILTAVGSMLGRAEKHTPEDSPLRAELQEVREITQTTLDNVRSLSQALHPVMLEEIGTGEHDRLVPAHGGKADRDSHILRKIGNVVSGERECRHPCLSGAAGSAEQRDAPFGSERGVGAAALSAGSARARSGGSRQRFCDEQAAKQGIGLVAMRERAELLGGTIEFRAASGGGTLVRLTSAAERKWSRMPNKISVLLVDDHSLVRRGFRRILEDEADIDVVGEAGDGNEAVQLARGTSSRK